MNERRPITPDLKTLGRILAPNSPESIKIRRNPETGEKALFMEAVGLNLPRDFFMTDFDEFALDRLYEGDTKKQLAASVTDEFARRGVKAYVDRYTMANYFYVLRGVGEWEDRDRPAWSGSFPSIRARYNAMRMLEDGVFPDHKRYIQYVTAAILSEGRPASESSKVLGICTTAPIVDMMILDLSETAPRELIRVVEGAIEEYLENNPNSEKQIAFKDFIDNFRKGFILQAPPKNRNYQYDGIVNQSVSALWLDKLSTESSLFRAENMEYVLESLRIFVQESNRSLPTATGPKADRRPVDAWMRKTYGASLVNMGSAIVNIVMGLDFDREDVAEMVDRGLGYLQDTGLLSKTRIAILR